MMEVRELRLQTGLSQSYVEACDERRKSVENAMAIMLSATNGPENCFQRFWIPISLEK